MKKITNVEVRLHKLNIANVIATSGEPGFGNTSITDPNIIGVGSREFLNFEQDEFIW